MATKSSKGIETDVLRIYHRDLYGSKWEEVGDPADLGLLLDLVHTWLDTTMPMALALREHARFEPVEFHSFGVHPDDHNTIVCMSLAESLRDKLLHLRRIIDFAAAYQFVERRTPAGQAPGAEEEVASRNPVN